MNSVTCVKVVNAALAFFILCLPAEGAARKRKAKPSGKYTVAVLAFSNTSAQAEYESLGTGLQSMVTTDLAHVGVVDVVERARLNEIMAEQKLAKTRMMDKKRVVKLGKMVGATHLLAGEFHIQGSQMRIDARLFSVQDGRILLAEKSVGEKDAFFELQKELVNRVIRSLEVKPTAKERAKIARIHTAEFKAFEAFSDGVRSFDEKRYNRAVESLRKAQAFDGDFKLAAFTLEKYDRIINALRVKAEQSEIVLQERLRKKADTERSAVETAIQKLWTIATRPGTEPSLERATALFVLTGMSESSWPAHWDKFHVKRLRQSLGRAYLSEALALFPKIPLSASWATRRRGIRFDPAKDSVEEQFERLQKDMLGRVNAFPRGARSCRGSILYHVPNLPWAYRDHLGLQTTEATQLFDKLMTMALAAKLERFDECPEGDKLDWNRLRIESLKKLADGYRALLQFDKSTALLAPLSREATDPRTITKYAETIQLNRDLKAFKAKHKKSPEVLDRLRLLLSRDCGMRLGYVDSSWVRTISRFTELPDSKIRAHLTRLREPCRLFRLGAHPLRRLSDAARGTTVSTGPQSAVDATGELRFYQDERFPDRPKRAQLWAIDDRQRTDVRVRFTADFKPAADWGLGEATDAKGISQARPSVGFLFGIRDVNVSLRQLEKMKATKLEKHPRPMTAYLVQVQPSAIRLLRLEEQLSGGTHAQGHNLFDGKVLESKQMKTDADSVAVDVRVKPKRKKVEVAVGGRQVSFDLPGDARGYYGIHLVNPGYISVRNLRVD